MKRAKDVFLILGAIVSFLLFAGFFFLGISNYIMPALLDNLLKIVKQLTKISIARSAKLAYLFFALGAVELFSSVIALIARAKARPTPYTLTLIFHILKGMDLLVIIGCICGIISYRNGDELTIA